MKQGKEHQAQEKKGKKELQEKVNTIKMNTSRAFKNWRLREDETLTSFEDWKNNILYSLKQDRDFAPFTKKGVTWTKTKTNPTKGD